MKYKLSLVFLSLVAISCKQPQQGTGASEKKQPNANAIKNESLPKDIKVDDHTKEIIDSMYSLKDGVKKLTGISDYKFSNKILVSVAHYFFKDDSLNSSYIYTCDENGNYVKLVETYGTRGSKLTEKTRDEYGNVTLLKTTEGNVPVVLSYENSYANGKLVKKEVRGNGQIIESNSYVYDASGNMVKESGTLLTGDPYNSVNTFNQSKQPLTHVRFINKKISDSLGYEYKDSLLIGEWHAQAFEGKLIQPSATRYYYDADRHMIRQTYGSADNRYERFDALGNWQEKKQLWDGKLNEMASRTIISR